MTPQDSSPRSLRGYVDLLRSSRDFRLLFTASVISLAGDWFLTVALLDLVLAMSGSATLASLMTVCQTLPVFFMAPFAGHLIDRLDRKKLMIGVDLSRVGAALLPLLARTPAMLWLAFAGVIMISVGASIFNPASNAALPNMVTAEELPRANVLFGSTWGTMLAVGAALGGLATMKLGRDASFVIDAVTFLASAFLISRIRAPFSEVRERSHEMPGLREAIRQTWVYAKENPRVMALLTSKGGYGIGAGVVAMLSVFGRQVFHAAAGGIGVLYAARGIGALIGPFIVRGVSRTPDQEYRLISIAIFVFGIGYVGLAFSPSLWIGAAAVVLAHLGGGAQWMTSTYGLQREVPDWVRGRVFATDYGLVTLTMSISSLVAGVGADRIGPVIATAGVASLCVLWAVVWGIGTRRLWR